MSGRAQPRGDHGSASLELVIIAPAFLALLGLLILAGRVAVAGNSVEQAAGEAARSASISRTASGARSAATDGARRALAEQDLRCSTVSLSLDANAFSLPVGVPAQVRVTVTCVVRLSDLALPGFPGSRTVTATAVSPLDTYRERG